MRHLLIIAVVAWLFPLLGAAQINPPPISIQITSSGLLPAYNVGIPGKTKAYTIGPSNNFSFTAVATSDEPIITRLRFEVVEVLECTDYSSSAEPNDDKGHYTLTRATQVVLSTPTTEGVTSKTLGPHLSSVPGSTPVGGQCTNTSDTVLRRIFKIRAVASSVAGFFPTTRSTPYLEVIHYVSLRVLAWNINRGKWGCNDGGCTVGLSHFWKTDNLVNGYVAQKINGRRVDVALLQEISVLDDISTPNYCDWPNQGNPVDQRETLRSQLGMGYVSNNPTQWGNKTNAVFTALPTVPSLGYPYAIGDGAWAVRSVLNFSGRYVAAYSVYAGRTMEAIVSQTNTLATILRHNHDPSFSGSSPIYDEYGNVARFVAGGDLNSWFPGVPATSSIPMLRSMYCNGELAGPFFSHSGFGIDHVFFTAQAAVDQDGTGIYSCGTAGPWANQWISRYAFSTNAWARDAALDPEYGPKGLKELRCSYVWNDPTLKDKYRRLEPSNHPTHVVTLEYVP